MLHQLSNVFRVSIISVAGLSALNGCATYQLSAKECLYSDWHAVGHIDGSRGAPANQVLYYENQCNPQGVNVDSNQYEKGRVKGVEPFCTVDNGFHVSLQGYDYSSDTCPSDLELDFLQGYQVGLDLYLVSSQLRRVNNSISDNATSILVSTILGVTTASPAVRSQASADLQAAGKTGKTLNSQRDYLVTQCRKLKVDAIAMGYKPPDYICQ